MARAERILQAVVLTPWAIVPEKLDAIMEVLQVRITGVEIDASAAAYAAAAPPAQVEGKVAVMPIFGMTARRMNMMMAASGGVSLESVRRQFDAYVNDPEVKAIVLQIDSPGGETAGIPEMAAHIYNARSKKRIVALADTMMASAAYWLGTAATEVVATPSAYVGSVGVFAVHVDKSEALKEQGIKYTIIKAGKYKAEGIGTEPLTDAARDNMQENVDRIYEEFVHTLARQREVPPKQVRETFGQGRLVHAEAAKAAGMIDRIDTLEGVLERLGVGAVGVGNVRRSRAAHVDRMAALHESLSRTDVS